MVTIMRTLFRPLLVVAIALTAISTPSHSAVIFLYDFPGSPGSGLASSQTNGQPTGATFSDFTRTGGLTQMPGAPANNTYGTETWNQTGVINTAQYEGFSITAAGGSHLNLTSLSFDLALKPSGPLNFEVGLFLNGSSTAYATLDITPTVTLTTYTFDFTDLTDANNVTSAAFRFFGWNAGCQRGRDNPRQCGNKRNHYERARVTVCHVRSLARWTRIIFVRNDDSPSKPASTFPGSNRFDYRLTTRALPVRQNVVANAVSLAVPRRGRCHRGTCLTSGGSIHQTAPPGNGATTISRTGVASGDDDSGACQR